MHGWSKLLDSLVVTVTDMNVTGSFHIGSEQNVE